MKIIITEQEMADFIRARFELPQNCKVIISYPTNKKETKREYNPNAIPAFIDENIPVKNAYDEIVATMGHNKINAIKVLRGIAGYGLKEAKDAIENWTAFHHVLFHKNTWPNITYFSAGSPARFE